MSITTKDQAIALIRRAQKILCLSQSDARADGIASVLAFQAFGQKMGKEVVAVLPQGVGKRKIRRRASKIHYRRRLCRYFNYP